MHILSTSPRRRRHGYVLLLTLAFISVCAVLLGSICKWTSNEAAITARNNAYAGAVAAAEAATETTISQMHRDFLHQSLSSDVNTYNNVLPSTFITNSWPKDYRFSDNSGTRNHSSVVCQSWSSWTNVNTEYGNLFALVNTYQITSNAKRVTGPYAVSAAVRQNVQFTAIPIFQYAIFYSLDLEINPGAAMTVTGKTHGNANVYVAPGDTLTFLDAVTYAGSLFESRNPLDPSPTNHNYADFTAGKSHVSSMTLPIGMDNSSTNVVKILDIPPANEDQYSELGRQRFYNKSDLVITITNNNVSVKFNNNEDGTHFTDVRPDSTGVNVGVGGINIGTGGSNSGPGNSSSNLVTVSANTAYSFINTNVSFYDYREGKSILGSEIDVKALTNWLAKSGFDLDVQAQAQTGHGINSIYINDQRNASGRLTAVRVANGQFLPNAGLTIATPQPLYVKGNFNAPDLTKGSTNTVDTKPAAFVSDAITILSPNWSDAYTSTNALATRVATNATVNAAFMSGIVSTTKVGDVGHYSGGVENFPRFLENWSGSTMTYNGSMVVMFNSRQATNFWISPGTYYNPPTRKWAFDKNFLSSTKLPPNTPQVRKLDRGQWTVVQAH